jgi:hypothetical protein
MARAPLFEHAATPLRLLMDKASDPEVALMSWTLFAAVYGVVRFGVQDKMISAPHDALEEAIDQFVRLTCTDMPNIPRALSALPEIPRSRDRKTAARAIKSRGWRQ